MNFGEQLARAALESLGYFVIQGFKVGVREADFLAVKRNGDNFKCFHIEAQISWSPSGVLRSQAKYENSAIDWKKAAKDYAHKKFFQEKLLKSIEGFLGTDKYERILIYGKLKEPRQIQIIKAEGIRCIAIEKLVDDAAKNGRMTNAFTEMYNITRL